MVRDGNVAVSMNCGMIVVEVENTYGEEGDISLVALIDGREARRLAEQLNKAAALWERGPKRK